MKTQLPLVCLLATALTAFAADPTAALTRLWETEATLKKPESVRFDPSAKLLYVANINGDPWTKDGNGSIAKVSLDGKILAAEWITGLDAPKGMALHGGKLYVADLTQIVVIDLATASITQRIEVPGAERLNDLTVAADGTLYVSDFQAGKIHAINPAGQLSLYLENLKTPNGLLAHGDALYLLDSGALYRAASDKTLTKLVDGLEGGTDGIEHVSGDTFIVTCWAGVIYQITGTEKTLLLDTRATKTSSADLGYDPARRTVYAPTFGKNSVIAYKLN